MSGQGLVVAMVCSPCGSKCRPPPWIRPHQVSAARYPHPGFTPGAARVAGIRRTARPLLVTGRGRVRIWPVPHAGPGRLAVLLGRRGEMERIEAELLIP